MGDERESKCIKTPALTGCRTTVEFPKVFLLIAPHPSSPGVVLPTTLGICTS